MSATHARPNCNAMTHVSLVFNTDAYDLFAISLVAPMIGYVYYPQFNGKLPRT